MNKENGGNLSSEHTLAESPNQNTFNVSAPSINLPKGGGAIKGIGEKFAANSGTGSLTIPTSPRRAGFGPQLSLSYNSGSCNSPFGLGVNLSLTAITRKTNKCLPHYFDAVDSGVFNFLRTEDPVPLITQDDEGNWNPDVLPPRTVDVKKYRGRPIASGSRDTSRTTSAVDTWIITLRRSGTSSPRTKSPPGMTG